MLNHTLLSVKFQLYFIDACTNGGAARNLALL